MSGPDGTFRFEELAEGRYTVCGQMLGSQWLNPCDWGKPPAPFWIPAASQTTKVSLVMVKGAVVPIRIDDPAQILLSTEAKTSGAHLLIGTGNDAFFFLPATLKSQDSTGRNLESVIPVDVPMTLVVSSSFYQLVDAKGTPLAKGSSTQIPILVKSGSESAGVRLIVAGAGK
jgi:hypothetical protein